MTTKCYFKTTGEPYVVLAYELNDRAGMLNHSAYAEATKDEYAAYVARVNALQPSKKPATKSLKPAAKATKVATKPLKAPKATKVPKGLKDRKAKE